MNPSMRFRALVAASACALGGAVWAADAAPTAALSGQVSSKEEGPMEGVLVTARKTGSPIRVTVVSDATGRYSFPADRLAPGAHELSIRASGYDLSGAGKVSLPVKGAARADLALTKTKDVASQMVAAEWMVSMPGTPKQKISLIDCTGCHTTERVHRSPHTAESWGPTLYRMSNYSFVSSWLKPQVRADSGPNLGEGEPGLPERFKELARYLASVNIGAEKDWKFPLQTFARPKGKATNVIVTQYDLPRREIQPHDVVLDKDGYAWYSDFGDQYIGRIDPRTGEHKGWKLPIMKPANHPVGTLALEIASDGTLWIAGMHQGYLASFDPKTEQFRIYPLPPELNTEKVRVTMLTAPLPGSKTVWILDQGGNEIVRLNIETGAMERFQPLNSLPPGGPRAIYGIEPDAEGNLYMTEFLTHFIGRLDAKTSEVKWWQTPTLDSWPRRLKRDEQGNFWIGEWHAGKVAKFDPKTEAFTEFDIPTPFSGAYDAVADRTGKVWAGGMSTDRIARIDPKSREVVEYLMPDDTNMRRAFVDNGAKRPTFWVGSNHGAAIVKVEPLD